jgi:hypothetical protein
MVLPESFMVLPESFMVLPESFMVLPESFMVLPESFMVLREAFWVVPEYFPALQERFWGAFFGVFIDKNCFGGWFWGRTAGFGEIIERNLRLELGVSFLGRCRWWFA